MIPLSMKTYNGTPEDTKYDPTINEAYANLANAIILAACKDYAGVIKDKEKRREMGKSPKKYGTEDFFKSTWFDTLCMSKLQGETVIKQLKKNYMKYGETIPSAEQLNLYEKTKEAKDAKSVRQHTDEREKK